MLLHAFSLFGIPCLVFGVWYLDMLLTLNINMKQVHDDGMTQPTPELRVNHKP